MKSTPVNARNSMARTTLNTALAGLPVPMASTAGPRSATAKKTARAPRAAYRATWSDTTISTTTAPGGMSRNTATFGILLKLTPDGHLTATAIGTGSARGAGPGCTIRRGALLPFTMAAGNVSRVAGAGAQLRDLL